MSCSIRAPTGAPSRSGYASRVGKPKSVYYEGRGVVCPLTLLAQQNINQQATAVRHGLEPEPCVLTSTRGSSNSSSGYLGSPCSGGDVRPLVVPQQLSSVSGSSVVVLTSDIPRPCRGCKNAIFDIRLAGPCGQPLNQATGNPIGQPSFRRM